MDEPMDDLTEAELERRRHQAALAKERFAAPKANPPMTEAEFEEWSSEFNKKLVSPVKLSSEARVLFDRS